MKYVFLLLVILLFSCSVDSKNSAIDVIHWTTWSGDERMKIRTAIIMDDEKKFYIIYEISGRHNDNELQPHLWKPGIHCEFADENGNLVESKIQTMVQPSQPSESDFQRFCFHNPTRGMIKIDAEITGRNTVIHDYLNEVDETETAKYEIFGNAKIRIVYTPIPKEFIHIQVDNYIDSTVASAWADLRSDG